MSDTGAPSSDAVSTRRASFLAGEQWYYRWFYQLGRTLVMLFTRPYTRMTIHGREHVPDEGGFILAPVHRSYIDTPIAACVTARRLRFMGKDSMWKYPIVGKVFSALGAFPIHRGRVDREAMKRAFTVLDGGDGLVLFPEGERKEGPVVQPLLDGAIYVAVRAGVPIVPVGIGGSAKVMPKGAKFIFPRRVHVEVGPPIMPPVGEGRVPRAAYAETSELLYNELQRLFDAATERVATRDR